MRGLMRSHQGWRTSAKAVIGRLDGAAPNHLSRNWRPLNARQQQYFRDFVIDNYVHPPDYWTTTQGQFDLHGLAAERLSSDRRHYVPWLDSVRRIAGLAVLEIGCGTGSST